MQRLKKFTALAMCMAFVYGGIQKSAAQTSEKPERDGIGYSSSLHLGVAYAGGFVPSYEIWNNHSSSHYAIDLRFQNISINAGKMITDYHGPRLLRGRGEALVEFSPFWRAYYPSQTTTIYYRDYPSSSNGFTFSSFSRYGIAVTPVLFRWNFMKNNHARQRHWAQVGGGLLWTNHKFPAFATSSSVINFTPQGGVGESIFLRRDQSLDVGVKVVHISNGGLADSNPGLTATLQFSLGYSWWR